MTIKFTDLNPLINHIEINQRNVCQDVRYIKLLTDIKKEKG
jgi:hypothetical protein